MLEKTLRFFEKIIPKPLYRLGQPVYHYILAVMGRIFYGQPSKSMFTVGVTGTKGKTTTVGLINAILEQAGEKTAMLSSIYRKVGDEREKKNSPNTMPGRMYIPKFLKEAHNKGCKYAILEVTSQGITQFRHKFIDWDTGVFLNLHPEHIESHGSFEKYREIKTKFFETMKKSSSEKKYFLINKEDQNAVYFKEAAEEVPKDEREIIMFSKDDVYKMVEDMKEKDQAPDWMYADFNISNLAAAAVFAKTRGIQHHIIVKAMQNFEGSPGRLEFVAKEPYQLVVDYAHTPESLKLLYRNLRENYNMAESGRLICVIGSAGGGRDKWKRPEIGKILASYADVVILTSEDPYDEDPQNIINDIKKGFAEVAENPTVIEELDRAKAMEKAISMAEPGDMVAITGIGSQSWFYGPKGEKIAWDEPKMAREFFEKYNN